MVDGTSTVPKPVQTHRAGLVHNLLQATEVDVRLVGMLIALAVIWIGFQFLSHGLFLTPRNLWNLSVQTAVISILANGMVLIIVSRGIDLSVGSLIGFLGMIMVVTQSEVLPWLAGSTVPGTWLIVIIVGLIFGAAIGAMQGFIIAYLQVPAFIVTLAGLLVWRGAAYLVTTGRTVPAIDPIYKWFGGGATGTIGANWSWVVGVIACIGIVTSIIMSRGQRRRFHFPLRPIWAEVFLSVVGCGTALGAIAVINAYPMPPILARRYAEAHNIPWPDGGLFISFGLSVPVLIALLAALVMAFVSKRTRFGRYVFAIGGNPDAAALAGINVRKVIMQTFIVMGILCDRRRARRHGAPRCCHRRPGHQLRALHDRCDGHRRHLLCRRHWHHFRRHAGAAGDAVAAVGHGADGHRYAHAERHHRHRAGHCGRHRYRVPTAGDMSGNTEMHL